MKCGCHTSYGPAQTFVCPHGNVINETIIPQLTPIDKLRLNDKEREAMEAAVDEASDSKDYPATLHYRVGFRDGWLAKGEYSKNNVINDPRVVRLVEAMVNIRNRTILWQANASSLLLKEIHTTASDALSALTTASDEDGKNGV